MSPFRRAVAGLVTVTTIVLAGLTIPLKDNSQRCRGWACLSHDKCALRVALGEPEARNVKIGSGTSPATTPALMIEIDWDAVTNAYLLTHTRLRSPGTPSH
jgi:hypothetical protein